MKIRPKQKIPLNSPQTWIRWKFEDQKINRSKREISRNWTETRKIYFQIFKYFALVTFSLLWKILSRNSCSKSKCFSVLLTVKKNFGQIILFTKNLLAIFSLVLVKDRPISRFSNPVSVKYFSTERKTLLKEFSLTEKRIGQKIWI